jgi:hypothetical protein
MTQPNKYYDLLERMQKYLIDNCIATEKEVTHFINVFGNNHDTLQGLLEVKTKYQTFTSHQKDHSLPF